MTGLSVLWLPILVSAVIVFVVSSIIHMASPWHKGDYPKLPNEDKVLEALCPDRGRVDLRPPDGGHVRMAVAPVVW